MFSKKQRLTKKEFENVFKKGKRIHSPTIQLIYTPSSSFHSVAVVGKKVCQKAVDRNLLRRRLYGAVFLYQKEHPLKGMYILIAKPALKEVSKEGFAQEVESVLEKV